jgi:hypothetical protein
MVQPGLYWNMTAVLTLSALNWLLNIFKMYITLQRDVWMLGISCSCLPSADILCCSYCW